MADETLEVFLGRLPAPEDRAIYADQTERLALVRSSPLLPADFGLQRHAPFEIEKP